MGLSWAYSTSFICFSLQDMGWHYYRQRSIIWSLMWDWLKFVLQSNFFTISDFIQPWQMDISQVRIICTLILLFWNVYVLEVKVPIINLYLLLGYINQHLDRLRIVLETYICIEYKTLWSNSDSSIRNWEGKTKYIFRRRCHCIYYYVYRFVR